MIVSEKRQLNATRGTQCSDFSQEEDAKLLCIDIIGCLQVGNIDDLVGNINSGFRNLANVVKCNILADRIELFVSIEQAIYREEIPCGYVCKPYFFIASILSKYVPIESCCFNSLIFDGQLQNFDTLVNEYARCLGSIKRVSLPLRIIATSVISSLERETYLWAGCVGESYLVLEKSSIWLKVHKYSAIMKLGFYYEIARSRPNYRYIDRDRLILGQGNQAISFKVYNKDTDGEHSYLKFLDAYSGHIRKQSRNFKMFVIHTKYILACHGIYPLVLNDIFLEVLCLSNYNDDICFGPFLNRLLSSDLMEYTCSRFNITSKTLTNLNYSSALILDLNGQSLKLNLLDNMYFMRAIRLFSAIRSSLKDYSIFSSNLMIRSKPFLTPVLSDYDIIFSSYSKNGFFEIDRGNNRPSFVLGKPIDSIFELDKDLPWLSEHCFVYYFPIYGILALKKKESFYSELLYIIILRTGFRYFIDNL